MTIANRDSFLAAAKRRFAEVDVTGLGTVRIRNLSELERSNIESMTVVDNAKQEGLGTTRWKARFILAAVVDADGNPVFADGEIQTVLAMDSAISDRLYDEIAYHCRVGESIEEQEKN